MQILLMAPTKVTSLPNAVYFECPTNPPLVRLLVTGAPDHPCDGSYNSTTKTARLNAEAFQFSQLLAGANQNINVQITVGDDNSVSDLRFAPR